MRTVAGVTESSPPGLVPSHIFDHVGAVEDEEEITYDGREANAEIRRLSEDQHGMVARWQLLQMGLTPRQVGRRVENERLVPVRRGVYGVGHRPEGNLVKWMSAVLACGHGAALSHRSAAALWGLIVWNGEAEVLSPYSGKRRGDEDENAQFEPPTVRRPRRLDSSETTVVKGIPVTSIVRTLIDLASVVDAERLSGALNEATRRGLLNPTELRVEVTCARGRKGVGTLRRLLEKWHPETVLTRSELEVRFLDFLDGYGFPKPAVNQRVEGFEVDFYWEFYELIVELDGREFHDTNRGFEIDRERTAALELSGRRVLRLTWSMVVHDTRGTYLKLAAYMRLALDTLPRPDAEIEAPYELSA